MDLFSQIGYLLSNYGDFFLKGLATTVILALVGTGVGLFLGTFLAFGERIKIKNDAKGLGVISSKAFATPIPSSSGEPR